MYLKISYILLPTDEMQSVLEIFRQIVTNKIVPVNVLCLGKVSNQCRSIRITLQNQHDIFNLIKNKTNYATVTNLNILIFLLIVHYFSVNILK